MPLPRILEEDDSKGKGNPLGGVDTLRGIAFQQAWAIRECLDALDDPQAAAVRVEGTEDIVDIEVLSLQGTPMRLVQARTRREPYVWKPGEVAQVLLRWESLAASSEAVLLFVTDGSLGVGASAIRDATDKARRGASEEQIAAVLHGAKVKTALPSSEVLRRVLMISRADSTIAQLDLLSWRVLTLVEPIRLLSTDDATSIIEKLFVKMFRKGTDPSPAARVITREDILTILGVTEAELASHDSMWDEEAFKRYATNARTAPAILPITLPSRVLRLSSGVETTSREAVFVRSAETLEALFEFDQAVLIGATGAGKTVALRILAKSAIDRGLCPIYLTADGHSPGTVQRRIRHAVEREITARLSWSGVQRLLSDNRLLLLIDRVSEVGADARSALQQDLANLSALRPLRIIAAGRSIDAAAVMPDPDLAGRFQLEEFGRDERRKVATAVLGANSGSVLAELESRLGSLLGNPLLLSMALDLTSHGRIIGSRIEIYDQFLHGLLERAGGDPTAVALATLGIAWSRLLNAPRQRIGEYEWREQIGSALSELRGHPSFQGHEVNVEHVLSIATRSGLLVRTDFEVGLAPLHDSFGDFLAARALANGWCDIEDELDQRRDEQMLFCFEMGEAPSSLEDLIAKQNPFLAVRLGAAHDARSQSLSAQRIWGLLGCLCGDSGLPLLEPYGGIQIFEKESSVAIVLDVESSGTLSSTEEFLLKAKTNPSWVISRCRTNLGLSTHLWATAVNALLRSPTPFHHVEIPHDLGKVAALIQQQEEATKQNCLRLLGEILPDKDRRIRLLESFGGLGLNAVVTGETDTPFGRMVSVSYRRVPSDILVVLRGDTRVEEGQLTGATTADALLREHPQEAAATRILEALRAITLESWPEA